MNTENAAQHINVKQDHETETSRVQNKVDNYERDRIGQGDTAKKGAKILNAVTLGNAGDTIGAPDKDVKSMFIDKGRYEKAKQNDGKK